MTAQKDNQLMIPEFSGASKEKKITIESPKNHYQRKEQYPLGLMNSIMGLTNQHLRILKLKKASLGAGVSPSGKKVPRFRFPRLCIFKWNDSKCWKESKLLLIKKIFFRAKRILIIQPLMVIRVKRWAMLLTFRLIMEKLLILLHS